jgi:hypothetical protein
MVALLYGHVLLATAGYVGLIATNVYVLFLSHSREPLIVRVGLTAWRKSTRVFGPMLALGVVIGFFLAANSRVPLSSVWLIATYVLVAIAMGVQVAVMIPWQLRSSNALESGALPSMTPVVFVLVMLSLLYTSILWLMVSRPG